MSKKYNGRFLPGGIPKQISPLRKQRLQTVFILKRTRYLIECNLWKYGMSMLKQIHQEIAPQIRAKIEAESKQDNLVKKSSCVTIARLMLSKEFEPLTHEEA